MLLKRVLLSAALALVLCSSSGLADVKPHALVSEGMVIQQGKPITIWGTAAPDEKVTVTLKTAKPAEAACTAGKDGKWAAFLPGQKAGGPFELTLQGKNTVTIKEVYIGEVWICSGQSNMEWPVNASANAEEAREKSYNEKIRLFTVPHLRVDASAANVMGSWQKCGPKTVGSFSAVAYYFGRDLQKALEVPIGLIHTSVGGTAAEEWTSNKVLEADADLKPLAAKGSRLYNGMIAPLLPYGIKGAIWYQGESNAGSYDRAAQYHKLFPAMIKNWRTDFNQGEFPFLFVQLAPFMKIEAEPTDTPWARLREVQRLTALEVPSTAMAVITDVGDEKDIHPKKKEPVGARLALAARALAYGEKIEYSGPVYDKMRVEDGKAILTFTHLGGGLQSLEGKVDGFTVAGEDGHFVKADAVIKGDTVVVSSPKIVRPLAVRYGWANYPQTNLSNKAGLLASPFRTDDWAPNGRRK